MLLSCDKLGIEGWVGTESYFVITWSYVGEEEPRAVFAYMM